jgi:hypothetical protein
LIQPAQVRFRWKAKTERQIAEERQAYEAAASQTSFFDKELCALNPCPYAFQFEWTDADGKRHRSSCDDWETAATYYRREKAMGARGALASMEKTFRQDYPSQGMVFAMGTHSRRPEQWLLVGVLRLDRVNQMSLGLRMLSSLRRALHTSRSAAGLIYSGPFSPPR